MKSFLYITAFVALTLTACQTTPKQETQSRIIFDTLDGRPLQIYLPQGHSAENKYPVIYMHDGQNLFLEETSYNGEWGADEVMDSLIALGVMPPTIIVGVYNSSQRAEEYVPYNDERVMKFMNMEFWNGSLHLIFADFLTYDLLPYIESTYGASLEKSDRALIGSSFGGIQALWMGFNYPEYFGFIGAMSPSVWVDGGAIIREVHGFDSIPDIKMWVDVGAYEYDPKCSELVQNLHQRGLTYGKKLWYQEDPDGIHHESSWRKRVANPFILFKGKSAQGSTKYKASLVEATNGDTRNTPIRYPLVNVDLKLDNGITYNAMHLATYHSDEWELDSVGMVIRPFTNQSARINITMPDASLEMNFTLSDKVFRSEGD